MPRIGLVGVPIETVPIICDDFPLYQLSAYLPTITHKTRECIVKKAKQKDIFVEDLGELCLGDYYRTGLNDNYLRIRGLHLMYLNRIQERDINKLEEARKHVVSISKDFDLLVAIGPSHLGAIVLYAEKDRVARLDYHADFANKNPRKIYFNYASYMDWVKKNIKRLHVTNYFVKYREQGAVFGRDSQDISDDIFSQANHFDIDVDCFKLTCRMQTVLTYEHGLPTATPEVVLSMIARAKPKKIGVWEFRPLWCDAEIGFDFIVSAIEAAVSDNEERLNKNLSLANQIQSQRC